MDENAPAVAPTPRCQMAFIPEESEDEISEAENNTIQVPVYGDSQRNEFICSLPVGCLKEDRDDWLKKSVIIYLGMN